MLTLSSLDWAVVALYFVMVFAVAWFVTDKDKSSSDYFLGGRGLGWFAIGASLFGSNIGSEHLVGLAGTGASSGVAVGHFEVLAGFLLLLLGWLFAPFYIHSGVATMPEYLEKRYGVGARMYLSTISVVAYVITKISVTIFAGAVVFQTIGLDFWTGTLVVVLSTGVYTVFGGLKAVVYTDAIQVIVMILGSLLVTVLGLNQLGGWSELRAQLPAEHFNMWKPMTDPQFPWTGILFGAPILGLWYWCTDQFIVQRVLSAKNLTEARRGTIFAGFLKLLPVVLFIFPGMICFALARRGDFVLSHSDLALPTLVMNVAPTGIKGLIMAGLLAAIMSSLSSVFNSCSTLITYDFYQKWKPHAADRELLIVGQVATVILVLLGVAWIPLMKYVSSGIYTYLQSIQAYISPPIAAIFFWGLFSPRLNQAGAMAALFVGLILGTLRLSLEVTKSEFLGWMVQMNFLHFAFFLFVFCTVVLFVVSYVSNQPQKANIENLLYKGMKFIQNDGDRRNLQLSILLVFFIISLWMYFSPFYFN